MEAPVLRSHLQTENLYVRQQIVRDNLAKLRNFKSDQSFCKKPWDLRRNIQKQLDAQVVLAVHIGKQIKKAEQLVMRFGGTID